MAALDPIDRAVQTVELRRKGDEMQAEIRRRFSDASAELLAEIMFTPWFITWADALWAQRPAKGAPPWPR
jgi:hypothetical protein